MNNTRFSDLAVGMRFYFHESDCAYYVGRLLFQKESDTTYSFVESFGPRVWPISGPAVKVVPFSQT